MADKPHITETPDTSYIKNVDVTHEVSDVYIGGIARFVLALVVLMVVSFVLMWAMFRVLQRQAVEAPRPPMALNEKERLPPEPRLQGAPGFAAELEKSAEAQKENKAEVSHEVKGALPVPKDPLWEIRVVRNQWHDVLEKGPMDQNGQRYGMPIEKAKEEVLRQLEKKKAESAKP